MRPAAAPSVPGHGALAAEPRARPFRRLERLATGRAGLVVLALWGLAEAIAFPIVPDVGLDLLGLVAPRRAVRLFAGVVVGALIGSAILYGLTLAYPDTVRAMLLSLPGIRPPMLASTSALVASGDPWSLAQFGPGTPLKVYTYAWALGPTAPAALAVGVVVNRITRIGPPLLVLALGGRLAPDFLRRHDRLVLAVYALLWAAGYALYWR